LTTHDVLEADRVVRSLEELKWEMIENVMRGES
jgi:hypothetical protein